MMRHVSATEPGDDQPPPRSRLVTWEDPAELAAGIRGLPGLEGMRAMINGELPPPPIATLLGVQLVSAEEGCAVFAAVPGEQHYNPIGVVHGGLAATMLDSAMACAVHTTLPAGVPYTSLELKLNFVRPITASTGRVLCEGKVVHRGSQIATAEGRLYVESTGKLLAHGVTTCLIMGPRAG
jgi:uncharacterized protein (TIGR00369 family)